MRIALVCPYAWDDPGGVQVHVRELGERLLAGGHAVTALAPVRTSAAEPWVRPVGRPVDITYNRSNAPIDPRPWSLPAVRDELERFGPDVVHVHEPFAPSTSLWATLAARAPVVATFHSGAARARLYDLAAPLLRRLARRIAIRVAVSEAAAQLARPRIGGEFEIVPNGVDVGRFIEAAPTDLGNGRKLLFVGRLDPRKGFRVALEAFTLVAHDHPELRLVVAGDGPERDRLGDLSPELRERVRMLASIPNRELPSIAAACDLYVGTSIGGESFGIVLVEAMAAGLPVVASEIPGYVEVVRDGVDGLLVPPNDPEAAAEAIGRVLKDGALAARLRAAGPTRAAVFDWSVVVARLEDLYERAVGAGPSVP